MFVLGISALYHDSAAALLRDGQLVAAAQEERFSRVKNDHRFPDQAIAFCLRTAGVRADELDWVVFYEKPLPKFERILLGSLATFPRSWQPFREAMIAWLGGKLWIKGTIMERLRISAERILFVEHHLSHAASAMFCSPFDEAAILTIDGVGEWTTTALGQASANWGDGRPNRIDLFSELRFPHSLGLLYSAFTAWLGFRVNSGEYKVMGLAPYGEPRYIDRVRRLIHLDSDGSFHLDLEYFSFHHSLDRTFSSRFEALFGPARHPDRPFFEDSASAAEDRYHADVAASVQLVTEEAILTIARHLHRQTGSSKLAFAGGVALNSVANGRLLREGPFDQVWIQPNAGDAGGALGAALYAYHALLGHPRRFTMEHAAWGEEYDPHRIRTALAQAGLSFAVVDDPDRLANLIVDRLTGGGVAGLFQGRFEWGPRALGQRSILADPRRPDMKAIVNGAIKFREQFRPFAPAILADQAAQVFDLGRAGGQDPWRFMLAVADVRSEWLDRIPAVSHFGTGRLQAVSPDPNPLYERIIRRFGEATSVPVLLNTSFNLRADPIVATPEEAIRTFLASGLDTLVMDDYLVVKAVES